MRNFRTFDELTEEYFLQRPEEIDDFLAESFDEYTKDNDAGALMAALRIIARVRGVSQVADTSGMTRRGVQKALSAKGNPRLNSLNAIMKAMGYCLVPQRLPENRTGAQ